MLVRALEIKIGRPAELRPLLEHKGVCRARIEPHLDDIGDLFPFGGVIGVAKELRRFGTEPDVGTGLFHGGGYTLDDDSVPQRLAGLPVREHRDRHPPGALTRDAPIGLALDHRRDAVSALWWNPAGLGDPSQSFLPQTVGLHTDEPLRRVA